MCKTVDEACEALDDLTLRSLELIEEKVSVTLQMEELLREGHIELAKARYIRGMENIGLLQVPVEADRFESLFEIQRNDEGSVIEFDVVNKKKNNDGEAIQDPIKWFGVLVPQNLRNAQKRFQAVLQISAKCANICTQILATEKKIEKLKTTKIELSEKEE